MSSTTFLKQANELGTHSGFIRFTQTKIMRACQPDLTHIKLPQKNWKGSQSCWVRAEVHLTQHPTPFSINLTRQMHLTECPEGQQMQGPHWKADNSSGKTVAAPLCTAQLKKAGLQPLKAPHHRVYHSAALPICTENCRFAFLSYCTRTWDNPTHSRIWAQTFLMWSSVDRRALIHQLPLGMSWHSAKPACLNPFVLSCNLFL